MGGSEQERGELVAAEACGRAAPRAGPGGSNDGPASNTAGSRAGGQVPRGGALSGRREGVEGEGERAPAREREREGGES